MNEFPFPVLGSRTLPRVSQSTPHPKTSANNASALLEFIFEPIEAYNSTALCMKAYIQLPYDERFTDNWGILDLLISKVMSQISHGALVRNVNTYYHSDSNNLKAGMVLRVSAHRVRDEWLQADISTAEGSLIATAYALYNHRPAAKVPEKTLGSPITIRKPRFPMYDPSK